MDVANAPRRARERAGRTRDCDRSRAPRAGSPRRARAPPSPPPTEQRRCRRALTARAGAAGALREAVGRGPAARAVEALEAVARLALHGVRRGLAGRPQLARDGRDVGEVGL